MKFGICTSLANAAPARNAGWDYIEESAQSFLAGLTPDADWKGPAQLAASPLPVPSVNLLVPAALKIVGTDVDVPALHQYITRTFSRAASVGIKICVFGSGAARNVPDGFDHRHATDQIIKFLQFASPLAADANITIAVEALNRKECNIINTHSEAAKIARDVSHPACRIVFDSYHFWAESEPLENLRAAARQVAHVHVADLKDRAAPGESKTAESANYRPLLEILKSARYDGLISVEALNFDVAAAGSRVLRFLRDQWQQA